MRNQVNYNGQVINIKRGPFGNAFVQQPHPAAVLSEDGLVKFHALCTNDSMEPGRIYACWSTLDGDLQDYFTLN